MKVEFERRIDENPTQKTLIKTEDFCCDDLEEAFKDNAIGFGDPNDDSDEDNNSVNGYSYNEDDERFDLEPLSFCPFCNDEIIIENVKFPMDTKVSIATQD